MTYTKQFKKNTKKYDLESKDVFLIHLTEQDGNNYYHIVDREIWDWATSVYDGLGDQNDEECIWHDEEMTESIANRWLKANPCGDKKLKSIEDIEITLTLGSWENDRLIYASYLNIKSFSSVTKMNKWLKDNKYNLVGETEGLIY